MLHYVLAGIAALLVACSSNPASIAKVRDVEGDSITITASAFGWRVRATPSPFPATILVSPSDKEYNVGETMYPDITHAVLWKISVPELRATFLILYAPPACSGASVMSVFHLLPGNVPVLVAEIRHHFEFGIVPNDPSARVVGGPGGTLLRDVLFVDSDGDGIPELRDDDAYRWEGSITYFRWDGQTFRPLWVEHYVAPPLMTITI